MTFQPVLAGTGYSGWLFLERTRAAQQKIFDNSAEIRREAEYFQSRIGSIKTAEDLVADRRLLNVALGAFGLEQDIDSRFFVQKILEGGSLDPASLANRLVDKRYLDLAKAFGFGDFPTPNTVLSDFGGEITDAWQQRRFEAAVGEQDSDLRLALGLGRDLADILARQKTANGRWYAVMGNRPVRAVIEKALGLPSSLGRLDLDQQMSAFRSAAERVFGDPDVTALATPEAQEKLVRLFLIRSEAENMASTNSAQIALTLLQSAPVPGWQTGASRW